jgi:hypothetical protein
LLQIERLFLRKRLTAMKLISAALRSRSHVLLGVTLLFLQGCGLTKSQLVKIDKNERPSVAALVSVQNEIKVEYFGFTVFSNELLRFSSPSDTQQYIEKVTGSILSSSKRINYVEIVSDVANLVRDKLRKEPNSSLNNKLTDEEISYLSAWGANQKIDYVLLIYPNVSINPIYGRPGYPTGKGVLADVGRTYLYSAYKAILVDTATSEIADYSGITTFKEIPRFAKELPQKEVDRVTKDWKYGMENDLLHKDPSQALEEMLVYASYFNGDDFEALDDHQIDVINDDIATVIKRNMTQHFIDLGLLAGKRSSIRFDVYKSKERLTKKAYRFD